MWGFGAALSPHSRFFFLKPMMPQTHETTWTAPQQRSKKVVARGTSPCVISASSTAPLPTTPSATSDE